MHAESKKMNHSRKHEAVALTDEMLEYAKLVQSDKQKSIDFLKRAGILNKKGKLAKEYDA